MSSVYHDPSEIRFDAHLLSISIGAQILIMFLLLSVSKTFEILLPNICFGNIL